MPTGVEIATGYISLVAETSKIPKQIDAALGAGGNNAVRAGQRMGRDMGDAIARTLPGAANGAASVLAGQMSDELTQEASDSGRLAGRRYGDAFTRSAADAVDGGPRFGDDFRRSAADSGGDAGDSFSGGFTTSVARLGGKGGPVLAAFAATALAIGKIIGPQIQAGMEAEASRDIVAARLGLDDASMAGVATAAAKAFTANFGESIDANMDTATAAIQAGLISATDDAGTQAAMIEKLTTVSSLLGEDVAAVARSVSQAVRTGIAVDAVQAFDLLTVAQRNGLNVSGDLLDTVDEYSTQFRKLGLDGAEAMGLMSQMVKNGARDTDIAADALKEFSIRVTDNSKSTRTAFEAVGLNADVMYQKFLAGGDTAKGAMQEVVDAINANGNAATQNETKLALFGTQYEDLGAAINAFDLSQASNEFGEVANASQRAADQMSSNVANEWTTAKNNLVVFASQVRDAWNMDEWFSSIPKAINEWFTPDPPPPAPGVPGTPPSPNITPGPAVAPAVPSPYISGQNPLDVFTIRPRANGWVDNPHVAQIAKAGDMRLWAEPETGGEAYIPLAPSKRGRSTELLSQVAGHFGYGLTQFDDGGVTVKLKDQGLANEDGLQSQAVLLNRAISQLFGPQLQSIGGVRSDSLPYHPSGRALDIMIPNYDTPEGAALGSQIKAYLMDNAEAFGLEDVIWQQYWQPGDGSMGNRMGDRGSDTQNHMDHVHATVAGGGKPKKDASYTLPMGGLFQDENGRWTLGSGEGAVPVNLPAGVGASARSSAADGPGSGGRSEGYIPAGAGNSSVAGTSFASGLLGMGAEAINGIIDQAASAASAAGGLAANAFAPGSGGAASAAIGIGAEMAKQGVRYGFKMAGIGVDALVEQLTPFGAPRLLSTDPTAFMPSWRGTATGTTTAEKAENTTEGVDPNTTEHGTAAQNPGGPVQPGQVPGTVDALRALTLPAGATPTGPLPGPGGSPVQPGPQPGPGTPPSMQPVGGDGTQLPPWMNLLGVYDQGGTLNPGDLAINAGRTPEHVLTERQWADVSAAAAAEPVLPGMSPSDYSVHIGEVRVADADAMQREISARQRLQMMRHAGRP
jgi:TP901 family phage tail tape measure protein